MMDEDAVINGEPAKVSSRTRPGTELPKLVIVALPVIVTASASVVPRSVVDAEASDADESALVLRRIAKPLRI